MRPDGPWLAVGAFALVLAFAGCDRGNQAKRPGNAASPSVTVETRAVALETAPTELPGLEHVRAGEERDAVKRTIRLIRAGGPFPYPRKDGSTFQNRERRLPKRSRGYYREYTVPTPRLSHRGARRIVAGSDKDLHYTRDHYKTFTRLTR
ncbi:MAG: ribonuclease T1 [Myxococcota bacterium]|jgi:ribonuclease T1